MFILCKIFQPSLTNTLAYNKNSQITKKIINYVRKKFYAIIFQDVPSVQGGGATLAPPPGPKFLPLQVLPPGDNHIKLFDSSFTFRTNKL